MKPTASIRTHNTTLTIKSGLKAGSGVAVQGWKNHNETFVAKTVHNNEP